MDRKEFLVKGGRLMILGGIAVSAGYLIINNKVDVTCTVSSTCEKCKELKGCDLPQAKEVRNDQK